MTYQSEFPDPIGVLYAVESDTYEDTMVAQLNQAVKKKSNGTVQDLLNTGDTWVVD